MNYLPTKLNKLRKHYNYSQSYVAEYLGVDVREYMGYENGNSIVGYSQMKKLASLYHISVLDVFKNSDDVPLYEYKNDTDELNIKYFTDKQTPISKFKNFVSEHKLATALIAGLIVAIIVLSAILTNTTKPYKIDKENVNRLAASETTVIYIDDSNSLGFSGSNSNGQINDLVSANAVKVCEGEGFSVVLNADGKVFSSGLINDLSKELSGWKNIVDIACGNNHVLGLDANGRVYCVGDDKPCEVYGTKNIKKIFASKNASILLDNNGVLTYAGSFIGSSSLKNLYNVIDIVSSDNILVVLNANHKLSVFSKTGTYLRSESWEDIVDIACGDDFVAGLDSYGKVHIEIENDDIKNSVDAWSNIIAIASGSDYLVAFDGKNIYGVGNNAYNQFMKEEKKKITLEKVSNITYEIKKDEVIVSFDGVNNATGYSVSINVGTGLSKHIDKAESVSFNSENMIEGKTYTIKIVALGDSQYKDSDEQSKTFLYTTEGLIELEIEKYVEEGIDREVLEDYLDSLGLNYSEKIDEEVICDGDVETVLKVNYKDGTYSKDDIDGEIKFSYCKMEN